MDKFLFQRLRLLFQTETCSTHPVDSRKGQKGEEKNKRRGGSIPRVSNRWPPISTKLNEAKVDSCRSQIQLKVAVIRLDNESHGPLR